MRLKIYSIVFEGVYFDRARFEPVLNQLLADTLPTDPAPGRPDVGFVILNQGDTDDRVVIAWWERENELSVRLFVRDGGMWRAARGRESLCVWDLEVLWFERCAYVDTILGLRATSAVQRYLARRAIR